MLVRTSPKRRGAIVVFTALLITVLLGFVALAVDTGMIALARNEAQNAADSAAMTGARSIDGSANPDMSAVTDNARAAARANLILLLTLVDSEITVENGTYRYNTTDEVFQPQFTLLDGERFNLTKVSVAFARDTYFARVLHVPSFNMYAEAIAAHRPRDITLILDFSGSMNNESDLWNNEGYLGTQNRTSNNKEAEFPKFGPYSDISTARLLCTSSDSRVGNCNITTSVLAGSSGVGVGPMVEDFYQHARGASSSSLAFPTSIKGAATLQDTPEGDKPIKVGANFIKTRNELTTGTTPTRAQFTATGYAAAQSGTFNGYTRGPNYWGKTFFIWPPDPTNLDLATDAGGTQRDWRRKFFMRSGGSYPTFGGAFTGDADNSRLWDTNIASCDNNENDLWRTPADGGYVINYKEILKWIKTRGPNPFPPLLRGGKVLYYDAIPDDVPASAYNHANANSQITNQNQRFWKEYIDYTIGVWRAPNGNIQEPGRPACSYGPDFRWGTPSITTTGGEASTCNPERPRHRLWFGPMTMVQFISDTGLLPGTAHDVSMYPAKLGVHGALKDIQTNHPNDQVALILFNRPRFDNEAVEMGRFSAAQIGFSSDYQAMIDALYYPPGSSTADVASYSANGVQTPRAYGDYTGNTTSSYGFMLAYNQFSGDTTNLTGNQGGRGRKGSQRLVIFETDGMANVGANATFTANGTNSYYHLGATDSVTPGGNARDVCIAVVDKMVALETDSNPGPGFSKPGRPVIIHCIGFGAVFESTAEGTEPANAKQFLVDISTRGGTHFPSSSTDTDGFKLCVGDIEARKTKLREAIRKISEGAVTVALIQ